MLSNLCIHCRKNQSNSLTCPSVKECSCKDPCSGLVFKAHEGGLQISKGTELPQSSPASHLYELPQERVQHKNFKGTIMPHIPWR